MRRQALSLLVENNPGVTTSYFRTVESRGTERSKSFSSRVTADPRYTRITIVASGDEQVLEQIEKQLASLRMFLISRSLSRDSQCGAYYDKDKSTRYTKTGSYECD